MGTTTLFNAFTAMPVLQWSHGLSAMDTRSSRTYQTSESGLQWRHGLSAMDTPGCVRCASRSMYLQWSHGFSAMDTAANDLNDLRERTRLQWSHGFSAMDTLENSAKRKLMSACFNGATAFQPWIRGNRVVILVTQVELQWSHGFSAMDTRHR